MTHFAADQTPPQPLDVLLVEDNPADAELCVAELRRAGWDARADVVQTAHEFCARLAGKPYDLVLSDYSLPTWTGADALELLQQMEKDIPFLLVTAHPKEEPALECLARGAFDYVHKERLGRLPVAVQRALEARAGRVERARMEQRAKEFERRFERLVELSPDALFIVSEDKVVFANAAAAKLLGADSPAALLGRPALSLIHPDGRAAAAGRFEKLSGTSEAAQFEDKLLRLDGKPLDVKVAAMGLAYRDAPAVQLIVRDVTERKRVEEAIKSLAAFAQFNPNPVLEFARDGKLMYFNDAASAMARSLGKDHPGAMLPGETTSIVQMCLTTGQTRLRMETSLGGRTFTWSFFPVNSSQVVHCYVNEITERLTLENQLRHAQKLESVGRLAAGVAHDFNNILTVIQGHVGLLRTEPNLTAAMAESLQQVSRAAERAIRLTGQLLTFSRRNVIQPRKVDLNEVLTNVSTLLHRTLGEDITFQFNYAANLPPIYADVGLLEQIIMNIAVNARDAMPRGGQLVITTALADVDDAHARHWTEARVGRFVCLTFIDTGCGMDNVTLSRLFEPFFTTKEFGKGTGLGLATVYGIVKRHQGWIEVQSQVGQGTTFKVYLPPYDQVSDKWAGETEPAAVRGGHETILVVEDEPPVRWTVKNILERYGYKVLEASAGVDALAVWHQHHQEIALLLTDMVMPAGLSGQELAEKFKSQKPTLKVIYTSGYSVEAAGQGLAELDQVRFLQKPYDAEKLALAVRQCLDS
jgi:PAS domain S-box-containing protein